MLRSIYFAEQLCFLYDQLPIDPENRSYVSGWLLKILSDLKSVVATNNELPVITKKIRDEVVGDKKKRSNELFSTIGFLYESQSAVAA